MDTRFLITTVAFAAIAATGNAQMQRRAVLAGGGSPDRGRCVAEVVVDGVAEVEIRGDFATLRDISGQQPQWRRFECTAPIPPNPSDFRFNGISGRGRQELVRSPQNGGVAVVRIEDPEGGSDGYSFEIAWSTGGAGAVTRGGDRGIDQRGRDRAIDQRGGIDRRRFSTDDAVRVCQDAI